MTIVLRVVGESKRMEELYTKPSPGEYIRLHDGVYKINFVVVTPNSCEVHAARLPEDHTHYAMLTAY
jgi:hypothetical protein